MATVPLSGTNITLLSGIPFQNDFKATRWFSSLAGQQTWFNSQTIVHSVNNFDLMYIDMNEKGKFIKINKSVDELYSTNYLMFQNATYNNRWFYAFVTHLEYVQRNHTNVYIEIDPLQTWMFDFTFKPSMVLREHAQQYDSNNIPIVNTIDEGLNYGSKYEVVHQENFVPYVYNGKQVFYLIVVSKSTLHNDASGKHNIITPVFNGLPQALSFYVHPIYLDGTSPNITIDGNVGTLSSMTDVLNAIYSDSNNVNEVVSLYVTDHIGINPVYNSTSGAIDYNGGIMSNVVIPDGTTNIMTLYLEQLPSYTGTSLDYGNPYSHFRSTTETKLYMYPYSMIVMTDFKGNRVEIRPEYLGLISNNKNLNVTARGSIGPNSKVVYSVDNYLNNNLASGDQALQSYENALVKNNTDNLAIVTDYLSAYMQGNRNSIQNDRKSIVANGILDGIGGTVGAVASASQGNLVGTISSITQVGKGVENSALKMQAINAKIKDIGNMPPQLQQMGDDVQYDYGNGYKGIYIQWVQLTEEYQGYLENFFNMYGYKCNQIKLPNLTTRQNWNYIQTQDCVITGNFNNEDLVEIKSIFDKGITLWHTDNWDYTQANGVV